MRVTIDPAVFERLPGLVVCVALAEGIDNAEGHAAIPGRWQRAWLDAGRAASLTHGNAQSHPRVAALRARFAAMGVSSQDYPSSVEAMLRRAIKGGEPFRINPVVDFANAVSLEHTVPVGAFDAAAVAEPVELRWSRDGDTFVAFDDPDLVAVPPGQLVWATGAAVLTRFFWRQARLALTTASTRAVLLVSEVLGEVGREAAEAVLNEFVVGFEVYFDAEPRACLLDAAHPTVSLTS